MTDTEGPGRGARRLSQLAATAASPSEVYDELAAEMLDLEDVAEVHVERLSRGDQAGVGVAYVADGERPKRIYDAPEELAGAAREALAAAGAVVDGASVLVRIGPVAAPRALVTVLWASTEPPSEQAVAAVETLAAVAGAAVSAMEGRLESSADPQTGCLNEAAMAARLDEEINRARRHGTQLACLLLSLDDLGEVARRHGPAMTEHTLGHVGAILRREFRRFDRVAYLGRGEFAILLPGAAGAQAEAVGRRVLARVHAIKLEEGGVRRALRASAGLGEWREPQGAWELVAAARAALLRAGPRAAEPTGAGGSSDPAPELSS